MDNPRQKAYISYARKSAASVKFIDDLLSAGEARAEMYTCVVAGEEFDINQISADTLSAHERENWELLYDKKAIQAGDSIRRYMTTLVEGEKIIFLLSEEYFKSRFCMHELMAAYTKRAGKMLPVVVLINGFVPAARLEQDLEIHWQRLKDDVAENATEVCEQILTYLPNVLAWLLGPYDQKLDYFETLFIRQGKKGAVEALYRQLDQKQVIRYSCVSIQAREEKIKAKIDLFLSNRFISTYTDLLSRRLAVKGLNPDLKQFFYNGKGIDWLIDVLVQLGGWLNDICEQEPEATQAKKSLAVHVKNLLSWLLIRCIDEKYLQKLVHFVNHRQEDVWLEWTAAQESIFQILVSSLCGLPAHYRLDGRGQLRAEGELSLLEAGFKKENMVAHIKNDLSWNSMCNDLYPQIFESVEGEPCPENIGELSGDAVRGRIDGLMSIVRDQDKTGLYMTHSETTLDSADKSQDFFAHLLERLPEVSQIIVGASPGLLEKRLPTARKNGELQMHLRHVHKTLKGLTDD